MWTTLPRRVYYIATALFALGCAVGPGPAAAQVQLTVAPMMVRGPAQAPLMIVEFSDYQ